MPDFAYADLLPLGEDHTPYRLVTSEGCLLYTSPSPRD